MKILALDTATEACSAALLLGDEVHERFEIAPRRHADLILPMARELLAAAGIGLSGLDAIAFGRGPGAFTGLRIAAGTVQGLAFGADLPVVPVSDLAALATRARRRHGIERVLVVQDARMQEVYWAAFDAAGAYPVAQTPEAVIAPADLPVNDFDGRWEGVGNGWAAYPEALAALADHANAVGRETHPHAEDIARLAALDVEAGRTVPPERAVPTYVRDQVARKPSGGET